MKSGQLIVLTGPSGVGKGTLVKALLARHPELYLSISATTRTPRPGEVEGKDYYFLSSEEFKKLIQTDQFLEYAEYAGNFYGTPRSKIEEKIEQGKIVLLEIEVIGARKIRETFPNALRIFILPPSMSELERRIRDRGTEAEAVISRRLERAKEEIELSDEFDLKIINEALETALQAIESAIFSSDGRELFGFNNGSHE